MHLGAHLVVNNDFALDTVSPLKKEQIWIFNELILTKDNILICNKLEL